VAEGRASCADCKTEKPTRTNVERNHGSTRNNHLKRRYGLTEAQVAERIEAQSGLCAICRAKPAEHVDHCHLTGDVRGILCFTCNVGLGSFGDSDHLMRLAADYVQGHQSTDPATLPADFPADWDLSAGLVARGAGRVG
jgi:hypothetical protein